MMCLGVPGQVVAVYDANGLRMGTADFGGVRREICLTYVPEAEVGSFVLVHVGFAISVISEADARETRSLLEEIGALSQDSGPELGEGPA
jgi:hydrogenase expression/formation protein HypC